MAPGPMKSKHGAWIEPVNKQKLLAKALCGSKNLRFKEVVVLAEAFGFRASRVKGSHHRGEGQAVSCEAVAGARREVESYASGR